MERMTLRTILNIVLIGLCLSGCVKVKKNESVQSEGGESPSGTNDSAPGDLQVYISRFEARSADAGHPVSASGTSVRFGNLTGKTVGICQYGNGLRSVTIDQTFWSRSSALSREQLIDHELGHCVLGRGHNISTDPGGRPLSIMYPVVLAPTDFDNYYWDYIHELFGGGNATSNDVVIPFPDTGEDSHSPSGKYECPGYLFEVP